MRVLTISLEYPPHIEGGLGRHVAELVPELAQQGVEVHVVTPASEATLRQLNLVSSKFPEEIGSVSAVSPQTIVTQENGVVVHRIVMPQSYNTDDLYNHVAEANRLLEAYVDQLDAQYGGWHLIHIHDWLTSFAGLTLKQAKNLPLVVTIHATERGRVRGHLNNNLQRSIDQAERNLINGADRVIVCSHYMFDELQSFFQTPAPKLDVIPNGVDIEGLNNHHDDDLAEFRAKYADRDERIVFTIARLVYEKGIHRLVEATPRILESCSSARILIAGKGPEAENLQRQAEGLGIADKVNFIGFISDDDRNRLFKVADCAVFPSLYEPFGIVALEAMALGCPVVVSDVGGFSEMVTHQETGITIYPDDAESVAWGVSFALTHPIWSRRHALRARQSVEELFNWPRIAKLTKEVYESALAKRKGNQ